jgi:lipopolysaccharide transport system ATP-binding protein
MKDDVVIRVERVGKKYLIGHQSERERYTALRDTLSRNARNFVRTVGDIIQGRAMVAGETW